MAKKLDEKKAMVKKNPIRHKILVAQSRTMGTPYVPYKVLYTEIVPDKETAKIREKELREEYKDTDALSIVSFSL